MQSDAFFSLLIFFFFYQTLSKHIGYHRQLKALYLHILFLADSWIILQNECSFSVMAQLTYIA